MPWHCEAARASESIPLAYEILLENFMTKVWMKIRQDFS